MKPQRFKLVRAKMPVLIAVITVLFTVTLVTILPGNIGHATKSAAALAGDLGPNSGLLSRDKLTDVAFGISSLLSAPPCGGKSSKENW